MRHPISKIAALALIAPLAGTMALAIPASAASTKATAGVVKTADAPLSSFTVTVSAPKKVKVNGKITYTIKAINRGPYEADSFYLGGVLPKGSKVTSVSAPKGTECDTYDNGYWCYMPWVLDVNYYETIKITVKLGKKSGRTAEASLGVETYDSPTGSENLSREELDRLGLKHWNFMKKVKTAITR
jgi:uncharacterized repeat protein (TIGR01451 family)